MRVIGGATRTCICGGGVGTSRSRADRQRHHLVSQGKTGWSSLIAWGC